MTSALKTHAGRLFANAVAVKVSGMKYFGKLILVLVIAVCADKLVGQEVDQRYGEVRGHAAQSMNGLSVFTQMLRQNNVEVDFYRTLSESMSTADLLVWIPDRFNAPTPAEINEFNRRYREDALPPILFIGRDYDGAISYWQQILSQLPPEQQSRAAEYLTELREQWTRRRNTNGGFQNDWFTYHSTDRWQPVSTLRGTLAEGVDVSNTNMVLTGQFHMPDLYDGDVLLLADGEPFVFWLPRHKYHQADVLVIANGSLLLNVSLVNHENRKIVQNLIDQLEPQRVAILGSTGQEVSETSNNENPFENPLNWVRVPPLNWIIPHMIFFGILYCFCYFPIFRRPRELPPENVSEFKSHIEAVAILLETTKDKRYAKGAIDHYRSISQQHHIG
ncbi:MAG TPA: hypothetical protein PKD64_04390 [Pirellulaceae bacterium]|nr:hypothetical protein [Pirellulaceae bacterium]HMO91412.1 hypothetical protein [Pirellulaceae bacterium]HMP69637.1 hypothetical protein [Pirellulaceae bacterium]